MRTTISIEDSLLEEAKAVALREKCSLGAVVEDALRARLLSQSKQGAQTERRPWITFGQGGVQQGVDLNDSGQLLEVMDQS